MTPRQGMLALLFGAAVINYLDRQSLSVAAPHISKQFHFSATQYSYIVVSFLLAYTIFHPIAGRLLDRLGTRTGFAVAMIWWSLAGMGQSLATGVLSFCAVRFLLGMGEAAFLPASVKSVSEWCTPAQRSLGVGLTNAGIGAGAMIATPMIATLVLHYEWRVAFLITGATGFLWLIFWWIFPHNSAPNRMTAAAAAAQPKSSAYSLLRQRPVIGLMAARFISDSAWWFYLFWIPTYLSAVRGFDLRKIGAFGWIPFLAALIGGIVPGPLTSLLIRAGWTLNNARKGAIYGSAALMPVALAAAFVREASWAIALVSLATFLIQIWASNLFALPADLFPPRQVASVVGMAGAAGSFAAMMFTLLVGWVVDHLSYTPILVSVALMHPLAAVVLHFTIPKLEGPES